MTQSLWTGAEFLEAVGGGGRGAAPDAISGISIDSRSIGPGEAFFAIVGDRLDGHDFVRDALGRGAALAVVAEKRLPDLDGAEPLAVVPDVLEALRKAGRAARARSDARIVAVTGSVGKTGAKEMLRLVLGGEGETHAAVASFNNHWGVPLTLARLPGSARFGVFEIGMNHSGEITPLTRLVRPHLAIVTTVEPVHLEFFDSVEEIADAKAEIFAGLEPGGIAILNRDNPHFERLAGHARAAGAEVRSFGQHAEADARLLTVATLPDVSVASAAVLGSEVAYKIGAPGRHLVQNSLAVLLAAKLLGADLALAALALAGFAAPKGRGERHTLRTPTGPATLLDESYNANPASVRAALALLGQTPLGGRGRRIAVMGDMLELGPAGEDLHRALVEPILSAKVDLVFAAGPLMRALYEALPAERRGGFAESAAELQPAVLAEVAGGDAVMVKGSLGSRMGPIVSALKRRFEMAAAADDVHA